MSVEWPAYVVSVWMFVGFADSLRFLFRPDVKLHKPVLESVATSQSASQGTLLLYRTTVAVFSVGILLGHSYTYGLTELRFFTFWNYVLLTLYFCMATYATWCHMQHKKSTSDGKKSGELTIFSYMTAVLFHVNLTTIWIVDLTTWLVLWPMYQKKHARDAVALAHVASRFFNIFSYVEHGLNAVFMITELIINDIPFSEKMMGWVGIWSLLYGCWAFFYYWQAGSWIYPFLDLSKREAPLFYIGIHVAHHIFFMLCKTLSVLKKTWLKNGKQAPKNGNGVKVH